MFNFAIYHWACGLMGYPSLDWIGLNTVEDLSFMLEVFCVKYLVVLGGIRGIYVVYSCPSILFFRGS